MMDPMSNDFFHDFMVFLKYLEQKPIQRTIAGNISRADIFALQPQFKQQKVFEEFKKFGWKIRTEKEVEFLTQIKIIAEVMYLTYNRKGKLLITQNGRGYLKNIGPVDQYWNMVLHYWERVNWEYFSPSPEINGISVIEILQKNQKVIWGTLLKNGKEWINFKVFCRTLKTYFQLQEYYRVKDYYPGLDDFDYCLDIEYGLIKKNLARFGCVVFEEEKDKYKIERIVRFRPTDLGLFTFGKTLENLL